MSACLSSSYPRTPPAGSTSYTIGQVVRQFGQAYIDKHQPAYRTVKILRDIANCRTAALGGHLVQCTACNYCKEVFNSCGNSNCPQCQNIKKQLWIDKMVHHLLPIKHYHIIFTLPHELNDLIFYNQRLFYNLLFRSAWQSIQQVAGLGQTGMVATLHTWGSNLSFHPHLHCIVPAGKLLDEKWVQLASSTQRCYCDAKELKKAFKEIYLKHLLILLEEADLYLGSLPKDRADMNYLNRLYRKIDRKKWCIRIEHPVLGVEQIIEYLGRYIKRVAITNSRIESISKTEVHFSHKVYAKQQKGKAAPVRTLPMSGVDFLQRFTQHILPSYFQRVRYYGLYGSAAKRSKTLAYLAITQEYPSVYQPPLKRQLLERMLGIDPDVCPDCACYNTLQSSPIVTNRQQYFSFSNYWKAGYLDTKRGPPMPIQKAG